MPPSNLHSAARKLFNETTLKAAGAGALGAFIGSIIAGTLLSPFFESGLQSRSSPGAMLLETALVMMMCGTALSAAILAYDNEASLRGRWNRDLWIGLPLFALIGFVGGGAGQLLYSMVGLTRGIPWALMGGGIGAGIGLLRRDKVQAGRGALGGALGGLLGGLLVDAALAISYTDDTFANATQLGFIVMGALIGLLMRMVQDALRNAWLLGISTGPYEGKEYALNTSRVTVGRSELNDIALFREEALPPQLGALVFQNNAWWWQGAPVMINGAFAPQAQLQPGDTIQLGATRFRYQTRSMKSPAAAPGAPAFPAAPPHYAPPPYAPPHQAPPYAPPHQAPPYAPPHQAPPYPPPPYAPPHGPAAVPFNANAQAAPTVAGASAQPVVPAVPVTVAGPSWVLKSVSPSGSAIRLPAAAAQVRLGRAAQNQIVLSEASVSSTHAQLDIGLNALSVTDLGSTNGTSVNGQRIAPHAPVSLRSGDRLAFGRLEYTVQSG